MNEIKVIDERDVLGKDFRIYGTVDEPLFLAKDVANWIDYNENKVGQMLKHIDEDEYLTSAIYYSGQVRNMYFLTENGLYEVLMQSRKPIAKPFKKEVKKILKSIRKHGAYILPTKLEEIIANPDTGIRLLQALKEEQEKNTSLRLTVEELKPRAEYASKILESKNAVNISQIAKDYGMSAIMMNRTLKNLGIQYKCGKQWLLYAKYQDKGYTKSETYTDTEKHKYSSMHTKWTQKGRFFLYEKLKEIVILPICEREK